MCYCTSLQCRGTPPWYHTKTLNVIERSYPTKRQGRVPLEPRGAGAQHKTPYHRKVLLCALAGILTITTKNKNTGPKLGAGQPKHRLLHT